MQWGITVDNKYIIDVLQAAQKDKMWNESWWAYFKFIYNWYTGWFKKNFNTQISVITVDINSDEFERLAMEWKVFWLWILYTGKWYRKARADWDITMDEIEEFKLEDNKRYGHNHAWRYVPQLKQWYIVETLWSATDKTIEMNIEELRAAVKAGIYYPTARTLDMKDKLLEKYLVKYQRRENVYEVEKLPEADRKAITKASRMRIFKRIKI
jgi:hypothetical protein